MAGTTTDTRWGQVAQKRPSSLLKCTSDPHFMAFSAFKADVCHAYQIVHKNGIPDEQIVVMMYDDLAENEEWVDLFFASMHHIFHSSPVSPWTVQRTSSVRVLYVGKRCKPHVPELGAVDQKGLGPLQMCETIDTNTQMFVFVECVPAAWAAAWGAC